MTRTVALTLTAALAAAAGAAAQVEEVARIADDDDEFGLKSTDAAVSVGEEAIVVTTNHGLTLLNKSGTILDQFKMTDSGFPFIRVDTDAGTVAPSRWFDGRTDYDAANDRQWISYSEQNAESGTSFDDDISAFHLAVSRDMSGSNVLDKLDSTDWWFFTGRTGAAGNGDIAFDFADPSMERYPDGTEHNPFPDQGTTTGPVALLDLPIIAIDDEYVYVTAFGKDADVIDPGPPVVYDTPYTFQAHFIIPIEFDDGGTTRSMLNGYKPDESDIVVLRPRDLPETEPEYERDFQNRHYPVQEPFEQEDNAQFFISLDRSSGEKDAIRLAGLWLDSSESPAQWRYTQHIIPAGSPGAGDLADMTVDTGLEFFTERDGYQIETPDTRTGDTFNPAVTSPFFSSAVLVKDANNDARIFATHHVFTQDTSGNVDGSHVQWYVIDPNLTDFRKVQDPATWEPEIVSMGRISDDGTNDGDCYFPSIGVTKQGVAYVEYTFSNSTTWPEVRRVQLTNSYSGVIPTSNVAVVPGPDNLAYTPGNDKWADFSDMQADPFTCDLWSVHTLVHDDGSNPSSVTDIDRRDVWLIENDISCNNANLNGDSQVDLYDMTEFTDFFATGARRVDMDTDGDTDSTDAALYQAAYDAATGP
ncbi:MAG: hypothetical protein RIB58_04170 [Phycisphaerales bacterium]